ncbi:MAG: hypothetical protein KY469_09010 [Actinobacteria bacterium]|nr:hypothetical protein [Actinomycetota bacterium]
MAGTPQEPPEAAISELRYVAPGGWRRALVGLLFGAAIGAAAALVLPRDEGPRRNRP